MDTTWLNLAIQATEQNDLPRARELLRGYVRYHSKDEQGWRWLSRVAETRQEQTWASQNLEALYKRGNTPPPTPRAAVATPVAARAPQARTNRPARRQAGASFPMLPIQTIAQGGVFAVAALLCFVVAIAVVPLFVGYRTLVVLSGSMEPAIPKGAVVIAQPVPSRTLREGDVIVFSPNADATIPIIHRITSIRERNGTTFYTTKGDANNASDPTEVSLPPTAWTVRFNVPLVGYVVTFASSPLGILLLIVAPVIAMLGTSVRGWVKRKSSAMSMST